MLVAPAAAVVVAADDVQMQFCANEHDDSRTKPDVTNYDFIAAISLENIFILEHGLHSNQFFVINLHVLEHQDSEFVGKHFLIVLFDLD